MCLCCKRTMVDVLDMFKNCWQRHGTMLWGRGTLTYFKQQATLWENDWRIMETRSEMKEMQLSEQRYYLEGVHQHVVYPFTSVEKPPWWLHWRVRSLFSFPKESSPVHRLEPCCREPLQRLQLLTKSHLAGFCLWPANQQWGSTRSF